MSGKDKKTKTATPVKSEESGPFQGPLIGVLVVMLAMAAMFLAITQFGVHIPHVSPIAEQFGIVPPTKSPQSESSSHTEVAPEDAVTQTETSQDDVTSEEATEDVVQDTIRSGDIDESNDQDTEEVSEDTTDIADQSPVIEEEVEEIEKTDEQTSSDKELDDSDISDFLDGGDEPEEDDGDEQEVESDIIEDRGEAESAGNDADTITPENEISETLEGDIERDDAQVADFITGESEVIEDTSDSTNEVVEDVSAGETGDTDSGTAEHSDIANEPETPEELIDDQIDDAIAESDEVELVEERIEETTDEEEEGAAQVTDEQVVDEQVADDQVTDEQVTNEEVVDGQVTDDQQTDEQETDKQLTEEATLSSAESDETLEVVSDDESTVGELVDDQIEDAESDELESVEERIEETTDEEEEGAQVTDEQVVDEQVTDEQAIDEQVSDDQATDEQVVDWQVTDDQVAEEQLSDYQQTDEPETDKQVTEEATLSSAESDETVEVVSDDGSTEEEPEIEEVDSTIETEDTELTIDQVELSEEPIQDVPVEQTSDTNEGESPIEGVDTHLEEPSTKSEVVEGDEEVENVSDGESPVKEVPVDSNERDESAEVEETSGEETVGEAATKSEGEAVVLDSAEIFEQFDDSLPVQDSPDDVVSGEIANEDEGETVDEGQSSVVKSEESQPEEEVQISEEDTGIVSSDEPASEIPDYLTEDEQLHWPEIKESFDVLKTDPVEAKNKFDSLNRMIGGKSHVCMYGSALAVERLSILNPKEERNAIQAFRALVNIGKNLPMEIMSPSLEIVVRLLIKSGRERMAVSTLEKYLPLLPDDENLKRLLVNTHINNDDPAAAIKSAEQLEQGLRDTKVILAQAYALKWEKDDDTIALKLAIDALQSVEVKDSEVVVTLGDLLQKFGDQEQAQQVFAEGVESGVLPSMSQRPLHYTPGITGQPVWGGRDKPVITDEDKQSIMSNIVDKGLMGDVDGVLVKEGVWGTYKLAENGQWLADECRVVSQLCDSLQNGQYKQVFVSVFFPSTTSWTHTAPDNTHLHILVPISGSVSLRLAEFNLKLQDETAVIDPSFEKEFSNSGETPAVVLVLSIPHPDLKF